MSHHDDRFARLMQLLQLEIARMLEQHNDRIRGHDEVNLDLGRGAVVYVRHNKTLWVGRVELIGTYLRDMSVWRWWWYGGDRPVTRSPLNAVYAAGQSHGVRLLTSPQPVVHDEREAVLLANVCAALAKARGVHLAQSGDRMTFYALYDPRKPSAASEPEVTPLPATEGESTVVHHDSLIPVGEPISPVTTTRQPIMSMPPSTFGPLPPVRLPPLKAPRIENAPLPPATESPLREPDRALVMPLAKLAMTAVVTHLTSGFQQALVTLDLQVQENRRARFYVVIVASDMDGNLVAVPTPQGIMEAARDLIAEDARQGNGRWRRLTARLRNRPTGISVRVEVVA
jgi:hypothetical protein